MDYEIQFSLAGLNIMLHMPHGIIINESFQPFVTESADASDIHIRIYEEENMNFPQASPVCVKIPFSVYEDESGHYRVFHDHKEGNMPYATGKILSDTEEEIHYLTKCRMFFSESQNTFSHIALEDLLLRRDAVVLHASYIDTIYGGILFSGPSGIGKSTQADLWCRYRNAKQVNGDRPILRRDKSGWKAYGSPYAGSSRCWLNRSSDKPDLPLPVLLLLKQFSPHMHHSIHLRSFPHTVSEMLLLCPSFEYRTLFPVPG